MPEKGVTQLLSEIAQRFTDKGVFLQACKEAWSQAHDVRRGRRDKKDVLFAAITATLVEWKRKNPKKMPSQGWIRDQLPEAIKKEATGSTIRKYVKLYLLKDRPAASFTINEKRWLKKNDAHQWRIHEEVMRTFDGIRQVSRMLSTLSRVGSSSSSTKGSIQQNRSASPRRKQKAKLLTREDILSSPDEVDLS